MTISRVKLYTLILAFVIICTTFTQTAEADTTITVRLMVAYDEEWTGIARRIYAYSPETLADIIVDQAYYHFWTLFSITYTIKEYTSWASDDGSHLPAVRLEEAFVETDFASASASGVDILVAFTGQEMGVEGEYVCYGKANPTLGVVLVRHTYLSGVGQATDNVLQHELSHLYGVDYDHFGEGLDCVMNVYPCWIGFPYNFYVLTGHVTNEWCSGCRNTIAANRQLWGVADGSGGGRQGVLLKPQGEVLGGVM